VQFGDPLPRHSTGVDDPVANLRIRPEDRPRLVLGAQVNLVRGNDRRDGLPLGNDEEAVEHAVARLGVGAGKDKHDLVGVGDDHPLAVGQLLRAAPLRCGHLPGEGVLARQHLLDDALQPDAILLPHLVDGDPHPVAQRHRVGRQAFFEQPPAHP